MVLATAPLTFARLNNNVQGTRPSLSKKRARQEEEEDLCSLSDPEEEDLRSLKVAQLKERCREMGLAAGGNHGVLVERLKEAMKKREEEEEEEEEAYFARYTAFTNRNYEFVIVAAKAVGEENGMMSKADWKRTTPKGGWRQRSCRCSSNATIPTEPPG